MLGIHSEHSVASPAKTTQTHTGILLQAEVLLDSAKGPFLGSTVLFSLGASGLCAVFCLFPGHEIQRPGSWSIAWRVRERKDTSSSPHLSHRHPPLSCPIPVAFPTQFSRNNQPILSMAPSLSRFPQPLFPALDELPRILADSLPIALVTFAVSTSLASIYADKYSYTIDPNQV